MILKNSSQSSSDDLKKNPSNSNTPLKKNPGKQKKEGKPPNPMIFQFSAFLTMLDPKGEKSLLCSADTSASRGPVLMLLF